MTRALDYKSSEPQSGYIARAVIFVHGYGADGADLLGLADPMAPHLPDTIFIAPNAPEACSVNPMGYQWFPIPWIDGSSEEDARAGLARAFDDFNAFLEQVMEENNLTARDVALVGFSQGTMLSLHVAPRLEDSLRAVVGFSGRLLEPERLKEEAECRPPVLLIHGDQDDVVPPQALPEAAEALQEAGWREVYAHIMRGTGHGIAPDGLQVCLAFLRDKFGLED
ncbi:MAG: alpha/beta fold hydrolase [Rhodobacteraceae bacterium]|jgi:phospholipase/carboxylesterase|uniref:alpha/beta hydrolase n=1 Tax=Roseovarius sp. 10 TaxID=3080563 RepID=UPI001935C3CE|nr:alpha/beta fold hydrolase [Roseovarius sp. 10]MBE1288530.1 alpha/beta fold hydrolase [Paracoccaceae bacterium]MDV7199918.1 alpha/beta fold hydrolase [Roseovarius sp. 10]QPI86001.1 alpha/beta fold hydrolase [Rhodobacterales bacterium HKCCA1288]